MNKISKISKTFIAITILILAVVSFFNCSEPVYTARIERPQQVQAQTIDTINDSIPTIDLSNEDTIIYIPITLKITPYEIYVNGNGLNSAYDTETKTLSLRVDDYNRLIYLKVNDAILLEERASSDYAYMEAGQVIVSDGNTLSKIARDHNVSVRDLKRWNPYLSARKYIKKGDIIKVTP